jgi:hypothetical protein
MTINDSKIHLHVSLILKKTAGKSEDENCQVISAATWA